MASARRSWLVVAMVLVAAGCGWFRSKPPIEPRIGARQEGVASWYGPGFHGNLTASGEVYDQHELTAAHPTLPLGTRVLVTNLQNGRQVEVRINDRGPFVKGRILDLSYAASRCLGMTRPGTARVRLEVLGFSAPRRTGVYALQVGAFADRRRAEAMQRRLAAKFGGASLRGWRVNGSTYYRLRVGRFRRYDEARRYAEKLAGDGFVPVIVAVDDEP